MLHVLEWHPAKLCCGPMANIALPERLRPAFLDLAGALRRVFPDAVVAMGGGSMLEARWDHRVSTDVDLFIAPRNLANAYDRYDGRLYDILLVALHEVRLDVGTDRRHQEKPGQSARVGPIDNV